ncbi:NAD(P)-dependent oxidoreductase [Halarchaeum sp. CBA1220]|uniref:SDR family oxidoreductase n=1 Tax=Halarchaeum sp. CBA1220 TaxID=1853682 RepID=UPI000F3A81EB|nr:NAD(P)-dependent oxidoreductase [Halarchaeum sp. CBA1220]QLC34399.1 NAD(P)-dependent oxidoreductase [Halarchaeum sp. CBA1220]
MHLLVLGANGLLGSNVVASAVARDWRVTGTYHTTAPDFDVPLHRLDVTDDAALRDRLAASDPDWVVNCAAMTDVDACESAPERAHAVNADAPGTLAAACAERDTRVLHVSTDYVFDGDRETPYAEDAPTNPLQTYGASKLDGERRVRSADADALLTRLSFVYGRHANTGALTGFPAWVRDRLADGAETPLFTDQHVTPTRAGHASETLCDLVDASASGTYHVATRSCVTPYAFGAALADRLDASDDHLVRGSRDDVDRAAARPAYTCLDVSRVERTLGRPQPTLADDIDAIADALGAPSDAPP